MGNIGGIEKIMVFGILIIILTILGIAVYSATRVDNDMTLNEDFSMNDEGAPSSPGSTPGDAIALLDSSPVGTNHSGSGQPIFRDYTPESAGNPAGDSSGLVRPDTHTLNTNTLNPSALKANVPVRGGEGDALDLFGENADNFMPATKTVNTETVNTESKAKEYTIVKGDSFMKIARVQYGDERVFKALMNANPSVDPHNLQVGDKIMLPARKTLLPTLTPVLTRPDTTEAADGKVYRVKKGDTLVKISNEFFGNAGMWNKIYEANRSIIDNPHVLPVGITIRIP